MQIYSSQNLQEVAENCNSQLETKTLILPKLYPNLRDPEQTHLSNLAEHKKVAHKCTKFMRFMQMYKVDLPSQSSKWQFCSLYYKHSIRKDAEHSLGGFESPHHVYEHGTKFFLGVCTTPSKP